MMPLSGSAEGDQTVNIGLLTLNDITFEATVDRIMTHARERLGGYVVTPNVDYVVRANRDAAFRAAINGGVLRVPDGMWIVYASRLAGTPLQGTVTGRLLLPAVAARAASERLPIALFGAGPGIADTVADRLRRRFPGLDVVATVTPPRNLIVGSPEDLACVDRLLERPFAVLFVALGAPKQELWMQAHVARFSGATAVGVGAAFDIESGRFRPAPAWMTRWGLEWLVRLAQEPRRLARRYLIDDPWILWWAVRRRVEARSWGER
jgi:N-acetylglucosaminyldiphosphoundecaprenol N-acetyl-beta-D-mannosaminyltransferase